MKNGTPLVPLSLKYSRGFLHIFLPIHWRKSAWIPGARNIRKWSREALSAHRAGEHTEVTRLAWSILARTRAVEQWHEDRNTVQTQLVALGAEDGMGSGGEKVRAIGHGNYMFLNTTRGWVDGCFSWDWKTNLNNGASFIPVCHWNTTENSARFSQRPLGNDTPGGFRAVDSDGYDSQRNASRANWEDRWGKHWWVCVSWWLGGNLTLLSDAVTFLLTRNARIIEDQAESPLPSEEINYLQMDSKSRSVSMFGQQRAH